METSLAESQTDSYFPTKKTGMSNYTVEESSWHNVVFVCVEVLQPSQPNGVMSSAVNLPNHTFTGQV